MLVGLGVTFGFTFSDLNVKLSLGLDETKVASPPSLLHPDIKQQTKRCPWDTTVSFSV